MTLDNENLFVSDSEYKLKLIKLSDGSIIEDFGNIHDCDNDFSRQSTVLTTGGQFFFTTSENGHLKQFCVHNRTLIQDFGKIANKIRYICY